MNRTGRTDWNTFINLGGGEGLNTTPCSECALNALAVDELLEYARLYLEGNILAFQVQ